MAILLAGLAIIGIVGGVIGLHYAKRERTEQVETETKGA